MRIYEELFILRPKTAEEEIDAYIEQLKQLITSSSGTVEKVEKWGVRRLAYRVEREGEGFYVLIQFSAAPALVKELERRMRVTDAVIKFITVRIDEKLKKIEKRRKAREKRAKRKPAPAPVAPPAQPGAPGAPGAPVPEAAAPAAPPEHPAPGAPEVTPETKPEAKEE